MNFEDRFLGKFHKENEFPTPHPLGIKKRKSFSDEFFESGFGSNLKKTGKGTIRLSEKAALMFRSMFNSSPSKSPNKERPFQQTEKTEDNKNSIHLQFSEGRRSSLYTEFSQPIITRHLPMSTSTDSYLPMSDKSSVITLPKSKTMKISSRNKFGTFRRSDASSSPYGNILKGRLNKTRTQLKAIDFDDAYSSLGSPLSCNNFPFNSILDSSFASTHSLPAIINTESKMNFYGQITPNKPFPRSRFFCVLSEKEKQIYQDGKPRTGAVNGEPGTGAVNGEPGTGAVNGEPGTGAVNGEPGTGALNGEPGTGALNGEPGTGALNGEPGTGALNGEPGTGALNGEPGTGALNGEPGTGALNGEPGTGALNGESGTGALNNELCASEMNNEPRANTLYSKPGSEICEIESFKKLKNTRATEKRFSLNLEDPKTSSFAEQDALDSNSCTDFKYASVFHQELIEKCSKFKFNRKHSQRKDSEKSLRPFEHCKLNNLENTDQEQKVEFCLKEPVKVKTPTELIFSENSLIYAKSEINSSTRVVRTEFTSNPNVSTKPEILPKPFIPSKPDFSLKRSLAKPHILVKPERLKDYKTICPTREINNNCIALKSNRRYSFESSLTSITDAFNENKRLLLKNKRDKETKDINKDSDIQENNNLKMYKKSIRNSNDISQSPKPLEHFQSSKVKNLVASFNHAFVAANSKSTCP